jgi:hypothetical protein
VETSEGIRLKIAYSGDSNPNAPRKHSKVDLTLASCHPGGGWPSGKAPAEGRVMSGGDWAFVRSDGVIILDARVTLAFQAALPGTPGKPDPTDVYLIDATLRGSIDLARSFAKRDGQTIGGDDAYRYFRAGTERVLDGAFDVVASVRFEASDINTVGLDRSWLPAHLKKSADRFADFAALLRQQFVAKGAIEVDNQRPYYPPRKINLNIFGI